MRLSTTIATLSALALASPVYAQSVGPELAPVPPTPQTLPEQATPEGTTPDQTTPDQAFSAQNFTAVTIVAMEDLPPDIKAQAEAVVTQTSAEDLRILQSSIDASPQAASALAANGLNSTQVVAANIDGDGTLTLIIQTTT
ncbi:hypothetical protein NKJ23_20625 [Mesorhizobium sp. M0184]|uniref:hypothetical protein n=1 Tax=Mesorhizobium sp. M0184 TaxID=2956906 RepID=UPI00333B29ED